MALIFYPHQDDVQKGSIEERIEVLMEAAERFKAIVLDEANKSIGVRLVPRDQTASFNWEAIARVLREIRDLPEGNKKDKIRKATVLTKLSEVYEVLRSAKMSKLEAVRLALLSEASHLGSVKE